VHALEVGGELDDLRVDLGHVRADVQALHDLVELVAGRGGSGSRCGLPDLPGLGIDAALVLEGEAAVGSALAELLPVLDDVSRAREHGDLEGAFKVVAESLEATVAKLGLERYGEAGDPFDPTVHEAISHAHSDEVQGPTCVQVYQPGYRHKGRVLRPAIVAVAEPD